MHQQSGHAVAPSQCRSRYGRNRSSARRDLLNSQRYGSRQRATLQHSRLLIRSSADTLPVTEKVGLDAKVAVVLGTQWGDEGKGKLVDILAQKYEIVARAQVTSSCLV